MIYFIHDNKGNLFATNNSYGATNCCNSCSIEHKKQKCLITGKQTRSGILNQKGFEIHFCESEAPDSKKVWKQKANLISELIPIIDAARQKANEDANQDLNRLLHNLKKFNAHCVQISDFFLDSFQTRNNNTTQRDSVKNIIRSKPDKAAVEILKTIKNIKLIQAEISVFDKLYNNEDIQIKSASHQAHRLINSIVRIFSDAFDDKEVTVIINESQHEIIADYETFTVALVHLIDNISKYTLSKSEVRIYFVEVESAINIHFAMTSLKIEEEELETIFNEGHSGYYATKLGIKGSGIGMFIIKQFISLNNGAFTVLNNVNPDNARMHMGVPYEDNLFTIAIPRAMPGYRIRKQSLI